MVEQVVYLSAAALAGVARFAVLRLVVFARDCSQAAVAGRTARPVPVGFTSAPVGPAELCRAA
ncbi:hypothetical protein [Kitasatospora sp. NPDC058218]|uniref:hypothetical protein n=1 Tax=Kitasatospora sp. NPDC058218 TaxID=3346385 RepID=UPI0036DCAC26